LEASLIYTTTYKMFSVFWLKWSLLYLWRLDDRDIIQCCSGFM
jgi:hypothetical protein